MIRKIALIFLIIVVGLLMGGWSNGSNGGDSFGTHDWVLKEAWDALGQPRWFKYKAAGLVTDNPDTMRKDFYYHVYDIWGKPHGDAPKKIQELFDKAVAQCRNLEYEKASRTIGLMSHYFSDVNNPLHTDQVSAEKSMYSSYKKAVNERTDKPDEDFYKIKFDGRNYKPDAALLTKNAAKAAHENYTRLVDQYNLASYDSTVDRITKKRLNRAVNELADLIYSVRSKADSPEPEIVPPPETAPAPEPDVSCNDCHL